MNKEQALKEMAEIEREIGKEILINGDFKIKNRLLHYKELKAIVEKPERWLANGDKYYYSSDFGYHQRLTYQKSTIESTIVINKKAFFTKEERDLDAKCNRILSIATCDPVDYDKPVYELYKSNIEWCLLSSSPVRNLFIKYVTNNKEKLQAAIDEIGQPLMDQFHNQKPILPCECEGMEI